MTRPCRSRANGARGRRTGRGGDRAAARVAVATVAGMLRADPRPEVIFCCFSEASAAHHRAAMEAL